MNPKSLCQLFNAYIEKFEYLNNERNCESYKWEAICSFQRIFDLSKHGDAFTNMLRAAKKATENIIDSYTQPFGGLVKLAEAGESERVRQILLDLLAPDNGNLMVRQGKINAFLSACDGLLTKYFPGSFLYKNDQRSAMAYLFFNDPDNHYLYKATEAKYLANCVGFYDDWGAMSEFKMDVYYRFCDKLIEAIKGTPALLATHTSRYEKTNKQMHPDTALHILAFDIIYCSHTYDLYNGLAFDKVTSSERKLYQEKKAKAIELLARIETAEADQALLDEARAYFSKLILSSGAVSHKSFGEADVESLEEDLITLRIRKTNERKSFILMHAIANGFIKVASEDFDDKLELYIAVMQRAAVIPKSLQDARNALIPYEKYLN